MYLEDFRNNQASPFFFKIYFLKEAMMNNWNFHWAVVNILVQTHYFFLNHVVTVLTDSVVK